MTRLLEATGDYLDPILADIEAETAPAGLRFIDLDAAPHRQRAPQGDYISGLAAVYGVIEPKPRGRHSNRPRMLIEPGAFTRAIACLDVGACWDHDRSEPLASTADGTLRLWEGVRGLFCRIHPRDCRAGYAALWNVRLGACRGMSFTIDPDRSVLTWSKHRGERLMIVHDAELVEVSLTPRPAFPQTSATYHRKEVSR